MQQIEGWLLLLYAASLPLSMTASWVLYIAGLSVTVLLRVLETRGDSTAPTAAGSFRDLLQAPLTIPLLIFTAAVFISGLLNGGLKEAFQSVWALKAVAVYLWAYLVFMRKPALIFGAAAAVLSTAAVAGIWGTVQQLTGWHPAGYPYLQGTGFLGGPMAFAGQMQLFSMLALGLLLGKGYNRLIRPFNNPLVFTMVTVANLLGAFFASERSAWLGLLAGVIAITLMRSWKVLCAGLAAMALMATGAWFAVPVVQTRLLPLLDWHNDISVKVRFFLWQQALEHWTSAPWFGIGIRRFPHYDIPEAIVPGKSIDINHAHSNIFQLATTLGIIGLLAYVWIMLKAALTAIRHISENSLFSPIALGVFGGTVALFVSGLFEYNFGTSQVRLAQWLILAMLLQRQASQVTLPESETLRAVDKNVVS
jgi:O-antigen ligase